MERYWELLEDKEFISALCQRMIGQTSVWGDPARLHIHETAEMVNTLFNTSSGLITVGAYTFTGHNVCILTGTHYAEAKLKERMNGVPWCGRDIVIGSGVWLASNSTILGPCTIGDNAVVAAGAVVVPGTTIPPNEIWGNIPARPLAKLEERMHKFTKKPEWADCRVQIEAADITIPTGRGECAVAVTLTNLGSEVISSQRKYPINLAYHILDQKGNMILFDGKRTPVYNEINPGVRRDMQMQIRIPPALNSSGEYICRLTLVAEGCFWFDQEGGNKLDIQLRFQ